MFNYFYPFWQMYNIYPHSKTSVNKLLKIVPFELDNKKNNERITILESPKNQIVKVQKYNQNTRKWDTVFKKDYDKYSETKVETGFWNEINDNILIISNTAGSGAFLSYFIIDFNNRKYNIIFQENEIFQGEVWLSNGEMIQKQGNLFSIIKKENDALIPVNYPQPLIPGAKIIEYKIMPNGKIILSKNRYYINSGDIVQLIRKDTNDIYERILFSSPINNLEFIKSRTAVKVVGKSPIEIEIIPGYDWENSKKINIIVK